MVAGDGTALNHFRHVILAAQRRGNRVLAAQLAPLGLTPAAAEVLTVLAEFQPLTIRELGQLIVCEADHPSRLVARLRQNGEVTTTPNADDKRAVDLTLTESGEHLAAVVARIEANLDREIDRLVDASEIELVTHTLTRLLEPPQRQALRRRFPPPPR